MASAGKQRLRRSGASAVQRVSDDDDEVLNVKSQTDQHTDTLPHTPAHSCTHLYNVLQTYVACGRLRCCCRCCCFCSWLRPSRLSQTTNLPQQPRLSQMLNGIWGQQQQTAECLLPFPACLLFEFHFIFFSASALAFPRHSRNMSAVSLASFSGSLSYWFAKKVLTKGEREKDEEGEKGGGQLLPFSVLRVVLTRLSFCHLQQLCQQQHVQRRGSL